MYVFILLCTPTMPICMHVHDQIPLQSFMMARLFLLHKYVFDFLQPWYLHYQSKTYGRTETYQKIHCHGQKLVFSVIKVSQVSPPSFPASIFARIWKQKSQNGNKILLQLLNNWKMVKKVQFSSREQRQGLCLILTCFLLKVGHVCGYAHFRCK